MVLQLSPTVVHVQLKGTSLHSNDLLPPLSPALLNILLNSQHYLYHSFDEEFPPICT